MSLSICTRCLGRLQLQSSRSALPSTTSLIRTSSFHTTSSNHAGQTRGQKIVYRKIGGGAYKKKKREMKKLPAIGERRQQRMRIVLSNTNAVEVRGLQDMSARNLPSEATLGKILAFDDAIIDKLREVKGFKKTQSWSLFRRPATLVRKETVDLAEMIDGISRAQRQDGKLETKRVLVSGERVSGKSVLLTQAMATAFLKGWVVINVPEAQEFVIDHFAYAPAAKSSDSDVQTYTQSTLAAAILSRMASANNSVLSKLQPNSPPPEALHIPAAEANTFQTIAKYGAGNPRNAQAIFDYLVAELTQPGKGHRPPVLFCVDGLDHWMGPSKYRSSEHEIIHAHQFSTIRTFNNLLFSHKHSLANGGIILGATSGSNVPNFPSFTILQRQLATLQKGIQPDSDEFPLPAPYQKVDSNVLSLLDPKAGTQIMELKGVSKPETAALIQYYVSSGILKEDVTAENVSEKWTLSGGGVVGQLCKLGERARIDPEKIVTRWGTDEGMKVGQGAHRPRKT